MQNPSRRLHNYSAVAAEIPPDRLDSPGGRSVALTHYCVDVDNLQGARDMIRYMIERGYRRIAMLAGPESYHYTGERVRGYLTALEEAGIRHHRVVHAGYEGEEARSAVLDVVNGWKPDAIFVGAGGDFLLDTLRALQEGESGRPAGTKPVGLSVFDDYSFLDFIAPGVTAVRQPLAEMGRQATRMLLELTEGREPAQRELVLAATVVPRESCGEATAPQR